MNISLIDEYVYFVLTDNGWTEKRDVPLADRWIERIEQKSGIQCSGYAREILHLFGGLKLLEFSPKCGQYFLEKCGGDIDHLEERYLRPLERLNRLSEKKSVDTYKGATFSFDAWAAFLEAVPIAEVRRLASKFFDCRCQKSAGILCVFQDFLAKAGGKFAVKMRAAAIGTAS